MIELIAVTLIACADLRVVDGDTIKCIDARNEGLAVAEQSHVLPVAPETGSRAKCDQERRLARDAKQRLSQLVKAPGVKIEDSRAVDSSDRPLVRIRLPNGKTAGQMLIDEGYAVVWTPGYKRPWCN